MAKFSASGQLTNSTFLGAAGAGYEYWARCGSGLPRASLRRGFTAYGGCTSQSSPNCFPTTPGAVIPSSNVGSCFELWKWLCIRFEPFLVNAFVFHAPWAIRMARRLATVRRLLASPWTRTEIFMWLGKRARRNPACHRGRIPEDPCTLQWYCGCRLCREVRPGKRQGSPLLYLTYLEATGIDLHRHSRRRGCRQPRQCVYWRLHAFADVPVTSGAIQNVCDPNVFPYNCAFVAKLNPTGTGLVWSTFVEPASFRHGHSTRSARECICGRQQQRLFSGRERSGA